MGKIAGRHEAVRVTRRAEGCTGNGPDYFQMVTVDTLPCPRVAATCFRNRLGIAQLTPENVMNLSARLAVSALAVALCAHTGAAAELTVSNLNVTPGDIDGGAQVKFTGSISAVCTDTSADGGCSSTTIGVDPSSPSPFACLDTSGDGQCADVPAAALTCHEQGRVWVLFGAFEGTKSSQAVGLPQGACAEKSGSFSGLLSARSVAAQTRVGIYASVKAPFGPTTIDPDNAATQIGQTSTQVTIHPPATLTSLSCAPLAILPGQSTTATVTMSRPVKTSTMIALSDSSPSITTPPSVTIPAGASSATFKVIRPFGTAPSPASVKAATPTDSKTCELQLR
jgi:ABC-type amino acid transport substrate-binding protein